MQEVPVSLANLMKFDSHARRRVYVPDLAFELALQHYQGQFAAVMESTITFRQLSLKAAHRNFHRLQGSLKWANIHSGVAPTEIRKGTFPLRCQTAAPETLALYTEVRKAGLGSRCSLRGRSR